MSDSARVLARLVRFTGLPSRVLLEEDADVVDALIDEMLAEQASD